jgi:hypothetical protein
MSTGTESHDAETDNCTRVVLFPGSASTHDDRQEQRVLKLAHYADAQAILLVSVQLTYLLSLLDCLSLRRTKHF